MAYQFESFQASLPSNVPSGWNDPPKMGSAATPSSASRLTQMRRRPVDPSIQGSGAFSAGMGQQPQQVHPQQQQQYGAAPTFNQSPQGQAYGQGQPMQQMPQSGYPNQGQPQQQLNQQLPPTQYPNSAQIQAQAPPAQQGQGYGVVDFHAHQQQSQYPVHPSPAPSTLSSSAAPSLPPQTHQAPPPFSTPNQQEQYNPVTAGLGYPPNNDQSVPHQPPDQYHSRSNQYAPEYQQAANLQQNTYQTAPPSNTTSSPSLPPPSSTMPSSNGSSDLHRPIYDAFTVQNTGEVPSVKSMDHFLVRPASSSSQANNGMPLSGPPPAQSAWSAASANPMQTAPIGVGATPPMSAMAPNSSDNTPPVCTSLDVNPASLVFAPPNVVDDDARRPFSQQEGSHYRTPVKAAGDVSLSGPQLVVFLTKASMRLPQVKCEGVQLRLQQLNELVHSNRVSEGCLKKLNFVVDAVDRELYDEASSFFEQMQAQFPQEMGAWSHGLRLLIFELKSTTSGRIGSAGSNMKAM